MILLLISVACITLSVSCTERLITEKDEYTHDKEDKDALSEDNQSFATMFSNLFAGKGDDRDEQHEKVSLPIKKIVIEESTKPLLVQSKTITSKKIQKTINLITSDLAQRKNLEIITPYMLIFGKPGTGKSTLALAIAYQMQKMADWDIYRAERTV